MGEGRHVRSENQALSSSRKLVWTLGISTPQSPSTVPVLCLVQNGLARDQGLGLRPEDSLHTSHGTPETDL